MIIETREVQPSDLPEGYTLDDDHENRQVLDMIANLYKTENEAILAGIDGTRDHLEPSHRQ